MKIKKFLYSSFLLLFFLPALASATPPGTVKVPIEIKNMKGAKYSVFCAYVDKNRSRHERYGLTKMIKIDYRNPKFETITSNDFKKTLTIIPKSIMQHPRFGVQCALHFRAPVDIETIDSSSKKLVSSVEEIHE